MSEQEEYIEFHNICGPAAGPVVCSGPLKVRKAVPFSSANARGDLRAVSSLDDVRDLANTSAQDFLDTFAKLRDR